MTDISLRTTNYQVEKRGWLWGTHGTEPGTNPTITLDFTNGGFVAGTHYPNGYVPSGTVLGKITDSGKYGVYDATANDGREVAAEGVRVNALRPGIIDTEIHDSSGIPGRVKMMRDAIPMKREGTADEVADAIMWLCAEQSSYVTGSIIPVAGGRC